MWLPVVWLWTNPSLLTILANSLPVSRGSLGKSYTSICRTPTNSSEISGGLIGLKAGLNGFPRPGEKLIHRLGLGVAARQSDYLGHEPAILISFDHNCVFSWHG